MKFVMLILGYFAIQTVSFGAFKTGGDIDTAELLVYAQRFSWGYGGSQPPLYNWMALSLTKVFGTELIVLSALKFGMLALALVSIYNGARALGLAEVAAFAAVLGIFAIPEIGWEAQRALSHSSAMLAFSATGFWLVTEMRRHTSNGLCSYSLLGIIVAAAILSKYNAIIFFLALFISCYTLSGWRVIVWNRMFLWSLLVTAVLIVPHLIWMINHPEMVGQRTEKLGIAAVEGWVAARTTGLLSLIAANVSTGGIVLIIYIITDGRIGHQRKSSASIAPDLQNLPLRVFLVGNLLIALGIIASGATEILNRWLQPMLIMLPLGLILAAMRFPLREGCPLYVVWIGRIGGTFAALALLMLPASIHLAPEYTAGRDQLGYAELFNELAAVADAPPAVIITTNSAVFANLRLIDSNLRVAHPMLGEAVDLLEQPAFLIWTGDSEIPPELAAYAERLGVTTEKPAVLGWQMSRARRDDLLSVWFAAANWKK